MYKSNQGGLWTTHDEQHFIRSMGMGEAESIKELSPERREYRRDCLAGYVRASEIWQRNWCGINGDACISLAKSLINEIDALNASGSLGAAA